MKINKPAWNCWWSPRTEREEGWSIVLPTSLTGVRAVRGVNVLPINKQNKTNISMRKQKQNKHRRNICKWYNQGNKIWLLVQLNVYIMSFRWVVKYWILCNICYDLKKYFLSTAKNWEKKFLFVKKTLVNKTTFCLSFVEIQKESWKKSKHQFGIWWTVKMTWCTQKVSV